MLKKPNDTEQRDRFIEAARQVGADEDEAAFKAKLAQIARQKPKDERAAADPVGWFVRVFTDKVDDDGYDSVLYIAGFPTPAEAENAVRNARQAPEETYEVLPGEITPESGPRPAQGEVRLILGAK